MSVEELKREMLDGWYGPRGLHLDCGGWGGSCEHDGALLDRLILEVQAEMPCYAKVGIYDCGTVIICPSCIARNRLKLITRPLLDMIV